MTALSTLFDAIERHDLRGLSEVLAEGADPDAPSADWPHYRPLHAAVEELEHGGSIAAIVLLLRAGARADERDGRNDATPLLMATFRGALEAARLFLAAGADVNAVGAEGDSPLRYCVERGHVGMVEELLLFGAGRSIDTAGGAKGMSALGLAVHSLNVQLVRLLLEAGADPHVEDADQRTAYERLPAREAADATTWDEVAALLRPGPG